jgi:hypothetical protein
MWMFSTDGFISVVAHRDLPGVMMVRARVKADLERIFGPDRQIETWPGADYLYRVLVDREELAQIVADQVREIDYWSHAKDEMIKRAPKTECGTRSKALYTTWSAFAELQPYRPYSKIPRSKETTARWTPPAAGAAAGQTVAAKTWVRNPNYVPTGRQRHFDWSTHPQSAAFSEATELGWDGDTAVDVSDDETDQMLGHLPDEDGLFVGPLTGVPDDVIPTTEEDWESLLAKETLRNGPAGKKRRRGSRGGKRKH